MALPPKKPLPKGVQPPAKPPADVKPVPKASPRPQDKPQGQPRPQPDRRPKPAAKKPGPPVKGPSLGPWQEVSPDARDIIKFIAGAAQDQRAVRIRYNPKVMTQPGGPDFGTTPAVYRTVSPYSLRFRNVHTSGYDEPPNKEVVFFGFDHNAETIKMFVVDRIKSVEFSRDTYVPQWEVEFAPVEAAVIRQAVRRLVEMTMTGQVGSVESPGPPVVYRSVYRRRRKAMRT
jgi:hypothetical protein